MATDTDTTAGEEPRSYVVSAVFSVLGPPALWFAHLNMVYPLPDVACALGSSWPFHVITVVILAGIAVAGVVSWRRRGGSFLADPRSHDASISHRNTFLAWCGILSSAVFGATVVMAHIAVLVVDPCLH